MHFIGMEMTHQTNIGKKHLKIGDAIIRITHSDEYQSFIPVTKRTRAPREGQAQILCPNCKDMYGVGHFSWSALMCPNCDKEVRKHEYYVEDVKRNKKYIRRWHH